MRSLLRGAPAVLACTAILAIAALHDVRAAPSAGRTYHLSPSGKDSNSGAQDAPWSTFSRAWQVLKQGDTLRVADGRYARPSPPIGVTGSAEEYITVQAVNPGGAELEPLVFKGNAYIAFVGFRVAGAEVAVAVSSAGPGKPSHHLAFQQIGFSCTAGTLNDNACFVMGDGTHHVLLEDSWGWGGGRYTVMCYGGPGGKPANLTCDYNTFRRLVLRMGPARSSGGNPQASLALYYAGNNVVENVIAIDGTASSDTSNSAFYMTGHAPPPTSDSNKYYGVIALNNLGVGFYLDCPGAICNAAEVRNSVFWGASLGALAIAGGCESVIIDHNTLAASRGNGYENYACKGATLTNNAIYRNAGYGARQSPSAGTTPTVGHNGYFTNTTGPRSGVTAGTRDLASDPAFAHITRVEAKSPYHGAGSTGDVGANVINRYEDGKLTATPLWPWPNEERLRKEMCAAPAAGFCASDKSLTRYIWEYLGKPIPPGIYPPAS